MPVFHIAALCSGSRGNAVFLQYDNTRILIDCGMSLRALGEALGAYQTTPAALDAVFITHEHIDHVRGLKMLAKQCTVPVHITEASADAYCRANGIEVPECFVRHAPVFRETVGQMELQSFPTSHDSSMSVGYAVTVGTHTFALATDMGQVTDTVKNALIGCEYVILESNHDENMLLLGSYPYPLKQRILSGTGHLSNDAAAALAVELMAHGTQKIMLAHLSENNNSPLLARQTVVSAFQMAGLLGCEEQLLIAEPHRIVALV